jgi:site-specific recombinase XerD
MTMPKMFKPTGSKNYVIFYTDHVGRRRKKTLTSDHATSERIVRDLLNKVALRKDGLVDERDERFADHERKPLKDHLEDFLRVVESKGATPRHVQGVGMRVRRILDFARMRRISDLSLSGVQEAVARVRQKRSQATTNAYIQAMKTFAKWLWRDKRAREHYLIDLAMKDSKHDRRHIRRLLSADDALKVIEVAERAPTPRGGDGQPGLRGADRAMLYRIALGTGFRAKELRTLLPERFRLDDDPPTITVLACYSKNRQEAVQPISAALADQIRPWLACKPRGKPVFEGMKIRTAELLRRDLKAAGVPYRTDDGVVDFHSFRGDYISALVASGASVKTCQVLARHADPSLTIGIYAKTSLHDISGAVEKLPTLTKTAPALEAMRATGTDGSVQNPVATQGATDDAAAGSSDGLNIFSGDELRDAEGVVISARGRRFDPWSGRMA